MLRVVTYARVSTVKQETEGQSLPNQERAFQAWLAREGAERIGRYAESKSAKSVEGREQFLRMIAELSALRPDLVIVDTMDRFSRNLKDGLDLLERFKGHGISLLPLDWDEPINLDADRDWKNVVQELTAADYERRRIRSRIVKQFHARRARGATLHSKCPLGLRKQGDVLVPVPELVRVVKRAERIFLDGGTREAVLRFVQRAAPKRAWTSVQGVRTFLRSPEYVKAGLRSMETQQRIDERLAADVVRYARVRRHDHSMALVFACGLCVALGVAPSKSLMIGHGRKARLLQYGECSFSLVCPLRRGVHDHNITVMEMMAERILVSIFRHVSEVEMLPALEMRKHENLERSWERILHRHLAEVEGADHAYRERTAEILRELSDIDDDEVSQIRDALTELHRKDNSLARHREGLLSDLSSGLASKARHPEYDWRAAVSKAADDWHEMDHRRKNDFARAFCESVGCCPLVYRNRRWPHEMWVTWYEIVPDKIWRARYGKPHPRIVEMLQRAPQNDNFQPLYV